MPECGRPVRTSRAPACGPGGRPPPLLLRGKLGPLRGHPLPCAPTPACLPTLFPEFSETWPTPHTAGGIVYLGTEQVRGFLRPRPVVHVYRPLRRGITAVSAGEIPRGQLALGLSLRCAGSARRMSRVRRRFPLRRGSASRVPAEGGWARLPPPLLSC